MILLSTEVYLFLSKGVFLIYFALFFKKDLLKNASKTLKTHFYIDFLMPVLAATKLPESCNFFDNRNFKH